MAEFKLQSQSKRNFQNAKIYKTKNPKNNKVFLELNQVISWIISRSKKFKELLNLNMKNLQLKQY